MEAFESGIGKLFTDPDPDNARAFFRTKSREMKSKVMSVKEAVEKFTKDGPAPSSHRQSRAAGAAARC